MSHMANQSIKSFKSKNHKKGSPMLTSLISLALQWAHPGFGGLSPGTGVISFKINSGEYCIAFKLKVAKTQRIYGSMTVMVWLRFLQQASI